MVGHVVAKMSKELLFTCQHLVYGEWSKAYDNMKMVRAEKDDGTADWELFHAERLKNNTAALRKWEALKAEVISLATVIT